MARMSRNCRSVAGAMAACVVTALAVTGAPGRASAGPTAPSTSAPATGTTTDITVHTADGRDRTARVYVPAGLRADRPIPLLVALHGGTGWGKQFERTSGYDALADEHGFIVTYPDGIGVGPRGDLFRTWNGGVCCGPAVRQDVDDVAFLKRLVATISDQQRIDPDRVFATGHSNGMIMAYRLLCEAADVFVAAAGQAGTLGVSHCRPSQPVSLRHIHGTADTNLPLDGGRGASSIAGIDFPSPRVGIRTFAAADGCTHGPKTTTHDPVTTRAWRSCDDGTVVELVTVDGASHAWMGSRGPTRPGGPVASTAYDSSRSSWDFLAAHPRRTAIK
jgi:polyhydroxybutyrate depolymerase